MGFKNISVFSATRAKHLKSQNPNYTVGKVLYRITGVTFFLVAALIIAGFLFEVHQIVKTGDILSLFLVIVSFAITIASGIFFARTDDVKSKLLKVSAWFVLLPIIVAIFAWLVSIIAFALSGAGDPLGLGILLGLIAWIFGSISAIGLIILLVYLIKRKK